MKQDFYDKKIVIFDLDFWEIAQHTVDAKIYTRKFLRAITANQNVIIVTNNSWFDAAQGIEDLGLKTGYMISNAGPTITNIATQKTTNTGEIDHETAIRICHLCVWNNLHFSLVTDDTRYPFNLSYWLIKKYHDDLSYLHKHMTNTIHMTPEIAATLDKGPIRKIEVYFLHKDHSQRNKDMIQFASLFQNEVDHCMNSSTLHLIPKEQSKSRNIQQIIDGLEHKINLHKDGIYAAIDQYDHEISKNSYFSVIKNELFDDIIITDPSELEILPLGEVSWVKWFYRHEHLWSGETSDKVKKSIDKYKDHTIIPNSLIALQNDKIKYLSIEKDGKNSSITERIKLYFWPQQVPQVVSILKKYKWNEKRN